jgi:hypothetical protein
MTDPAESASDGQPTVEHAALAAESVNGQPALAPAMPAAPAALSAPVDERPELVVGAAFAGGLALALLLKRLGR